MIPSRCEVTSDFLQETQVQLFDVSSADNSMKTMKKVQYQNHLRKLFLENQQQKSNERRVKKNNTSTAIKLLHADWACKLSNFRCKFMPDFETLKKPGFGFISKYDLEKAVTQLLIIYLQNTTSGPANKSSQHLHDAKFVFTTHSMGSQER